MSPRALVLFAAFAVPSFPQIHVDSSLVQIPVRVTTAHGAPVLGLNRESFRLSEDRVEQTIRSFSLEDAPVSLGILLDASGSMRGKMPKAVEAAQAFFRTMNQADESLLIAFNDKPRLKAAFTRNPDEIYDAIAHTRPAGVTALLDAIHLALVEMKHAVYPRRALVILSDGGDNWSSHSVREIRNTLIESDVQVYAMGIFDARMSSSEERLGPRLLDDLAETTGGRAYTVGSFEELPAIAAQLGRDLRSEYVLGYYSSNPGQDGKYHSVTVRLSSQSPELHMDYRRGYWSR